MLGARFLVINFPQSYWTFFGLGAISIQEWEQGGGGAQGLLLVVPIPRSSSSTALRMRSRSRSALASAQKWWKAAAVSSDTCLERPCEMSSVQMEATRLFRLFVREGMVGGAGTVALGR